MKVKDILKQITDTMLNINIIDDEIDYDYGTFKKNDSKLVYNPKLKNMKIVSINAQYYDTKRTLILRVK